MSIAIAITIAITITITYWTTSFALHILQLSCITKLKSSAKFILYDLFIMNP
jgi:hypothetical protein